jgi:hypothetical protein
MKKIFLITALLVSLVFANEVLTKNNPKVYAALGDVLYNNLPKIEKLKDIKVFEPFIAEINRYERDLLKLKKQGFAIEYGEKSIDKKQYLNKLREFSKQNDAFVSSARSSFKDSLANEDSATFEKIINTGLIDTKRNKEKIIDYYFAHQEDVNASGVIQSYLDADAKLRAKREAKRKYYKSKKQLEAQRIKRIRENDKLKQAALEKKLDEEVIKKKQEIREEQKKELFN